MDEPRNETVNSSHDDEMFGESSGSTLRNAAQSGKAAVRDGVEQASGKAREAAREVAAEGREVAREVVHEANALSRQYLHDAARRVAGFANAIDAAASTLRDQRQDGVAERVEMVADRLDQFAQRVSQQSWNDLFEDARGFARRNPGVFVAGAAVIGFALSRFFKASTTAQFSEAEGSYDPVEFDDLSEDEDMDDLDEAIFSDDEFESAYEGGTMPPSADQLRPQAGSFEQTYPPSDPAFPSTSYTPPSQSYGNTYPPDSHVTPTETTRSTSPYSTPTDRIDPLTGRRY
jgi:hypothetical protein